MSRALTGLNRSDKGILLMTLVDGLKPGEIAYRLGLTAEVVRARKSRALKRVIDRVSSLSRTRISYHLDCEGLLWTCCAR